MGEILVWAWFPTCENSSAPVRTVETKVKGVKGACGGKKEGETGVRSQTWTNAFLSRNEGSL